MLVIDLLIVAQRNTQRPVLRLGRAEQPCGGQEPVAGRQHQGPALEAAGDATSIRQPRPNQSRLAPQRHRPPRITLAPYQIA